MARSRRPRDPGEPRGSIHPLLDLHGLTASEARGLTERWLRGRAAAGERTVVVVTGRGTRSHGLPVLRPEIEHLLAGLQGSAVEAWDLTDGGGGFRITLARPSPARHADPDVEAARLARQHPPELRRRAEEALAELGVTPTPALVRAEIQRIVRETGG